MSAPTSIAATPTADIRKPNGVGSVAEQEQWRELRELPEPLVADLDDAARIAAELDHRMARLRDEIRSMETPRVRDH